MIAPDATAAPGPRETRIAIVAYGGLLIWVLLLAGGILYLNDGRFIYTLDDPYIHLAMSEGIYAGGYGVNDSEPAAASSSILFPFLLAWASPYAFHEYLPLAISLAALAGSVLCIRRFFAEIGFNASPAGRICATALTASITIAMNLIGLAFMGMENSLQVTLELLALLGLIRALAHDRIDWWLPAVLVLAPMVRYESTVLSGLALLALAGNGHRKPAIVAGLAIFGVFGIFSLYLISLGLPPLPNSVMAHSSLANHAVSGSGLAPIFLTATVQLIFKLAHIKGVILLIITVGMGWFALCAKRFSRPRADRWIAAIWSLACAVYLLSGQIGPTGRHETALFTLSTLIIIYLLRRQILDELDKRSFFRLSVISLAFLAAVGGNFVRGNWLVPIASNNIYEQQFQMHRLVTEYIRGRVAVNDIGWVSYRNNAYVLDLWGLASTDALRARRAGYTPESLERLTDEAGVELVMIYDTWFEALPVGSWKPMARLYTSKPAIYAAENVVSFYAPRKADTAILRKNLEEFATTLPRGVTLELF